MEKFTLKLDRNTCEVLVGKNSLNCLNEYLQDKKCLFIIDKLVYSSYSRFHSKYLSEIFKDTYKYDVYLLDSIETNKDISVVMDIVRHLSEKNYLRDSVIVGIGGGIIGDIAGFVSSIYMRGISFINIPTTLLAQVDSSIGGKNAINFSHCKNLIGTFNQPDKVLIDINFLTTLSKREIISGLAEIIKYGIICEYEFLTYIKQNLNDILNCDTELIYNVVRRSCEFKIGIIKQDEYDKAIRKILNHGHTIGHAIESITNYSLYTHGEAIIIGMYYESVIAYKFGLITCDYFKYIEEILKSFNIKFDSKILETNEFYDALLIDKKNKHNKISFILPIGKSKVEEYMFSVDEIKGYNLSEYYF